MISVLIALIIGASFIIILMTISVKRNKGNSAGTKKKTKSNSAIIKECSKKLSRDPHNINALTALGEVYYSLQDYEKAYPLYLTLSSLVKIHPELEKPKIFLRYGISAFKIDKKEDAIKGLGNLLHLEPKNYEGNFYMGKAMYGTKQYEKSIMCLKSALAIQPGNIDICETLGCALFYTKRYKECLQYLKKTLEIRPDNKEVLFCLASAMEETGMGDNAVKIFMHLRTDPNFGAQSCIAAGFLHEKQNQVDKAIQDYEIAAKAENVPSETKLTVLYRLAQAYLTQHNIAKALYNLKQIQAITPAYKDVASLIARYQELNQNTNLQAYLMSGTSDFVALCKKFVSSYYPNSFVKIEDISVVSETVEILCSVETTRMENTELFRFFRTTNAIGELYVRDLHTKMREIKCDKGFCITAGEFTSEAHKYVDGRPIDLIEKSKLINILKKITLV